MIFFIENLWIWIVFAFTIAGCGFYVFLNQRNFKLLAGTSGAALVVLLVGVVLVCFVPTQRKSISSVLHDISDGIVANDLERVQSHLSPKAGALRDLARRGLKMFKVEKANFNDLKIEVDERASPVVADVSFTGVFTWRYGLTGEGAFVARVKIKVRMERTPTTWLLTDEFDIGDIGSIL